MMSTRILHIIHLAHREDRLVTLMDELRIQQIPYRKIWDGFVDKELPAEDDVQFTAKQEVNNVSKPTDTRDLQDLLRRGILKK